MNDTERRALEVLNKDAFAYMPTAAASAVRAFSRAGLLVTPLHERALAACKQYSKQVIVYYGDSAVEVADVGREALAAEKPKERWTVKHHDTFSEVRRDGGMFVAFYGSECQWRAAHYAAQCNREEAAR